MLTVRPSPPGLYAVCGWGYIATLITGQSAHWCGDGNGSGMSTVHQSKEHEHTTSSVASATTIAVISVGVLSAGALCLCVCCFGPVTVNLLKRKKPYNTPR